jgi:dTDP-4-dehydrorhamnose reductase
VRVAVTGAGGRLGHAIVDALADAPFTGPAGPVGWDRAAFDLDLVTPASITALLDGDRPEMVIHAAAWTEVDGCALDPALATRRNADATGLLAAACAERGLDLLVISTNEVFDGTRTDGGAYAPDDPPAPANAYGASKLAGERAAEAAYGGSSGAGGSGGGGSGGARGSRGGPGGSGGARSRGALGIARVAWLFGPGKPDFPAKIAAAAERASAAGEALRVVADEFGTPTYVRDVADAIVELIAEDAIAGIHQLVNAGVASRAEWARDVLARLDLRVPVEDVSLDAFPRPSRPPRWGVLAPTPLPSGEPMRSWRDAMADYAPTLRRAVGAGR